MVDGRPVLTDPTVDRSQDSWGAMRRRLNRLRRPLSSTAVDLYPTEVRLDDTGLIAADGWLLDRPVDLDDVRLVQQFEAPAAAVTGGEPESSRVRPLATVTKRYARYSHALREVERPGLFENRLSYRLTGLRSDEGVPTMTIGLTTYFDMVDICEAVAHELAAAHLRDGSDKPDPASWRRLPFRRLIDDPFDLGRRALLPSIDTLTIRKGRDGASFILHQRDPAKVAVAGGEMHLMPAGVFQPSSIYPAAQQADLDLWRNVQREYSEEFLGNPEHDGDGAPADYTAEPFAALDRAKDAGSLTISYLGTALDALTLATEILTVAVIDADTYDDVFAALVEDNTEGRIVRHGQANPSPAIPFAEPVVRQLLDDGRLAPAAAGCLRLAWEHRHQLLGL